MNTRIYTLIALLVGAGANLAKADDNIEQRIANLETRVTQLELGHITLPAQPAKSDNKKSIFIHVNPDGTFLLEQKEYDLAGLSSKLKDLGSSQPKTHIIISSVNELDPRKIMAVSDACKAADLYYISYTSESSK